MPPAVCPSTPTHPSLPVLAVELSHLQEQRRLARTAGKVDVLAGLQRQIMAVRWRMSYFRRRSQILQQKKTDAQRPEKQAQRRAYVTSDAAREIRRRREKAQYAADPAFAADKRSRSAQRRAAKPAETRAVVQAWRAAHPGYAAQYHKRRSDADPIYGLSCRIRRRVAHAVAGTCKSSKTEELIGCSWKELREHIEALFLPGMSWENRTEWHVDHKIPCKAFDLTKPEQQKLCFHWSNLQPLWKMDNLTKGSKLPE